MIDLRIHGGRHSAPVANLRGQGPPAEASAARQSPRNTRNDACAICNCRDAAALVVGRGASAPARSRAAAGSAAS
jgi:hypothetical protein